MVSLFFYHSLKDWLGNFRYKKSTSWCYLLKWSGKRGSNSRPRPWQGRALPTELFPRLLVAKQRGVFYGFILLCQIKFVKKFFDWLKIIQKQKVRLK